MTLRSVIACSNALAAVVAAAEEVEISIVAKVENIALASVRSAPFTTIVFEPALETVAVATPAPMFEASTPSVETARSSKLVSLIR